MRRAVLALSFLFALTPTAPAQKVTSDTGDYWLGTVESVNESTREIKLASLDSRKPESFAGMLDEGFKAWMLDDSVRQPNVSEIPVGMHVRAYYETKQESVGGKKAKVNHIHAVLFLGRDDFDRLRIRLNLAPSTNITLNEAATLPASRPLKLYLIMEQHPTLKDNLVKWVEKWNKGEGDKYGRIEIVSDPTQANVALAAFKTIINLSQPASVPNPLPPLPLPSVAVFLITPKAGGLDVLWRQTIIFPAAQSQIEKEIERRTKARSKP
jgi:hypothetical protein